MASEKSWQGFNEQKFRENIQELEVEESPEELLALLKKFGLNNTSELIAYAFKSGML